jgi:hypothetical protein
VVENLIPLEASEEGVTLAAPREALHILDGARRQQNAIEELLTAAAGRPVRVRLAEAAPTPASVERPKRLSHKDLRDDKLRDLRSRDSALDAAADALDLEIVE